MMALSSAWWQAQSVRRSSSSTARATACCATRRLLWKVCDHHFDVDRLLVPDVVVGDVRHAGIADFGFAGEEGFGAGRHADDAASPLTENLAFAARAEARSFDGDIASALMNRAARPRGRLARRLSLSSAQNGSATETCATSPVSKNERPRSAFGEVDQLIGDDDVTGRIILAQRAAGVDGDDEAHAEHFQRADVGAIGDGRRREDVPDAVTRDEGDALAAQRADHHVGAGLAERRVDRAG